MTNHITVSQDSNSHKSTFFKITFFFCIWLDQKDKYHQADVCVSQLFLFRTNPYGQMCQIKLEMLLLWTWMTALVKSLFPWFSEAVVLNNIVSNLYLFTINSTQSVKCEFWLLDFCKLTGVNETRRKKNPKCRFYPASYQSLPPR